MSAPLESVDVAIELVGRALFVLAAVLFVIFAIDWLVRTRRLSPFGAVARFFRRTVDPLLEPVERRVVRSGGMPSSAPWWALVAAVAGGILLLLLLNAARGVVVEAMAATRSGKGLYHLAVQWTFGILRLALIVRVIAIWMRISVLQVGALDGAAHRVDAAPAAQRRAAGGDDGHQPARRDPAVVGRRGGAPLGMVR